MLEREALIVMAFGLGMQHVLEAAVYCIIHCAVRRGVFCG